MLDIIATTILLIAVGLGAGALGSMIGVGGGIIMVPALAFMGLQPTQVASTSLFAVTSTSLSSTIAYSRQKRIEYRLGLELAALAVPGAVLGAFVSSGISTQDFRLYFGVFLVIVGIYILYRNLILKERSVQKRSAGALTLMYGATFAAGIISSLFGVGGGVIFVPAMLLVLGMVMQRAVPTSQFTLMITSFAGIIAHALLGHPDYVYAIVLMIGTFFGAQLGAKWSKSATDIILQRVLGTVLIGVAIKFIVDWFFSK